MTAIENELDYLIKDLSDGLRSPSGAHRSRYYSKYSRKADGPGSNYSPVEPRRNTAQKGWYAEISKEMGTPRSITPILKQQFDMNNNTSSNTHIIKVHHEPSRSTSPYSRTSTPVRYERDRTLSPKIYSQHKSSSVSPSRREKSVVIGPVTEMVTKQEYFRHRDAQQGKPLPGTSDYQKGMHPFGYPHERSKRSEPRSDRLHTRSRSAHSPILGRKKYVDPHISEKEIEDLIRSVDGKGNQNEHARTRSVGPDITDEDIENLLRESRDKNNLTSTSLPSSPAPNWVKNLKHVIVDTIYDPVPPKFGAYKRGDPNAAAAPAEHGPPCELCHDKITERRCIIVENCKYHCWHYVCTFCSKTLQENDFLVAIDGKPYCTNCFRRTYP